MAISSLFSSNVRPEDPAEEQPVIGLIGMGAMGKMYASLLAKAGWKRIHVCDLPSKYEELKKQYSNVSNITVMKDGHAVARSSDFMMYSVEAEFINRVVAEYGPSTKIGAIVAGQTSVKAPEKEAFEKYLPEDTEILSCHSLHGPTVSPLGQPLILIKHRARDSSLHLVEQLFKSFGSRYVYLSYEEHDLVTANTQAVTHAAFLSMGTAWASAKVYPWEQGLYVGGMETVKVNLALRIYSNLWHVYAGLAILNPKAREQIDQYAKSVTEIYKLMVEAGNKTETEKVNGDSREPLTNGHRRGSVVADRNGNEVERERKLRERVEWAKNKVFGEHYNDGKRAPILLSQEILDKFSLGQRSSPPPSPGSSSTSNYTPNSHLSLLAMVDCWAHLSINPFDHLSLAATPLFRLFLGVAEHLFLQPSLLDSAIHSAIYDTWHRSDDLEFVVAARGWSQCVSFGSFEVYRKRFEETRAFFEGRFEEAGKLGSDMIKEVMKSEVENQNQVKVNGGNQS
ncbi:Prephenate dehydrogenase [Dendrothele bispora CBS 962.96]|uniref:Prephenate dehydrogenase n=1 Tax=Dendrothele bispora (strain CBS 962.96) TaxID=1314807 RepID=A0A4S8L6V8_DENBC|nr:Prephenate dehydrogenase [Dendrothele bispora CBS 962.96]